MVRKILKYIGKIVVSAALAFVVLNLFCCIYSNVPPHSKNENGSTDFSRPPYSFYSRWTEGGSFGKTNNEGLYNLYDYEEGMPVDVIIMGSSHVEGTYVPLEYGIAARLDERFQDKTVYNLGMASHTFLTCAKNLDAALTRYEPEYAAILATDLLYTDDKLSRAITGDIGELRSYTSGPIALIERIPYARLLYDNWDKSIENTINSIKGSKSETSDEIDPSEYQNTEQLLDQYLKELHDVAESHDAKLIIFYDPSTSLDENGSLVLGDGSDPVELFSDLCDKNGVLFLDMSERYLSQYNSSYVLPHGFWNSSVGSGHLNRYGHKMISDEIYSLISEVE